MVIQKEAFSNTENIVYNFSAGPSMLPKQVMLKAAEAILNFNMSNHSILEVNHRGPIFNEIRETILNKLKLVVYLPSNYHILLLHGGATQQFSSIPLNLTNIYDDVIYIDSGSWSKRAYFEASKLCNAHLLNTSTIDNHDKFDLLIKNYKPKYIHITTNETIDGIEYKDIPKFQNVPLVADMSSNIFTKPLDIEMFDLIYASTQKNLGAAGLCIVILNNKLLEYKSDRMIPDVLNYQQQIKKHSTFNTPSLFNWYLTSLMLEWIVEEGGLSTIEKKHDIKSSLLYKYIDNSKLFTNSIEKKWRSRINIKCNISKHDLLESFLKSAEAEGLCNLRGHASVGGIRISNYNAMPLEGINKLINYMAYFENKFT